MKIRVSYSELRSENFNNRSAQAQVEIDVNEKDLEAAFADAWRVAKRQVRLQLDGNPADRLREFDQSDDMPF